MQLTLRGFKTNPFWLMVLHRSATAAQSENSSKISRDYWSTQVSLYQFKNNGSKIYYYNAIVNGSAQISKGSLKQLSCSYKKSSKITKGALRYAGIQLFIQKLLLLVPLFVNGSEQISNSNSKQPSKRENSSKTTNFLNFINSEFENVLSSM